MCISLTNIKDVFALARTKNALPKILTVWKCLQERQCTYCIAYFLSNRGFMQCFLIWPPKTMTKIDLSSIRSTHIRLKEMSQDIYWYILDMNYLDWIKSNACKLSFESPSDQWAKTLESACLAPVNSCPVICHWFAFSSSITGVWYEMRPRVDSRSVTIYQFRKSHRRNKTTMVLSR